MQTFNNTHQRICAEIKVYSKDCYNKKSPQTTSVLYKITKSKCLFKESITTSGGGKGAVYKRYY